MIHYILQTLVFQLLFLAVYDLFLKNETFFTWNRVYLLITPLLSLVLPFVKLDIIRQSIPENYVIQLPTVFVGNTPPEGFLTSQLLDPIYIMSSSGISVSTIILLIWVLGAACSLALLGMKMYKINSLKASGKRTQIEAFQLVTLPNTDTAFSFMNTIYLGDQLSEAQKTNIILHEKVHISQRHSLDLLYFELLRILFWFNPLVYVFQNKMVTLQEFTADSVVVAQSGKRAYYEDLLAQIFKIESISFINTFFNQSLIKKRIRMLQKSKSKKIFQLKYLLLVPVVCAMLVYTSCSDETKPSEVAISESGSEVMDKINELSEAIMKKGNLTPEEEKALQFLATPAKSGDKVYTSVQEYLDEPESEDIAFAVIDKVPTFPGCEGLSSNEEAKKCMSEKIMHFVVDNFNTKVEGVEAINGRQRIMVQFKIDKSGSIANVKAKAAHPELETEAIRVVSKLPKMEPGVQEGKEVGVLYALPILFNIQE
ncbi:M56 family metallopeptidase [Ulvibacter litoralis]|uniref:TonB protein C-terminal n=1 Tax=Ulvibacter litoralis TaxID=227084 RepID=A0A1G7CLW6_9FLAO|nr:M56 family metallopeptidase [Ulvibacter litoralis]GHC46864.1 hypothetical protein GCM10008083_07460 [Ulvibacter litoralis]SDE40233.1 TonB protein C-terminal [Ulvibacter litoralis]